jgi:large repetitive protein
MNHRKINKKINNKGFTLVELLVVISIISLLASIMLVSFDSSREKGRIAAGVQFSQEADDTAGDQSVGLWDFSECSGATAGDHSNYGNNGTLMGGPFWTTDTPLWSVGSTSNNASSTGCSILLNGSQYIKVVNPSNAILDFGATTDFTLSVWVKDAGLNGPFIIDKRHSYGYGVGAAGYTLELSVGNDLPCLNLQDTTHAVYLCAPSGSYGDGKWHFYAVSVQRASLATFYVDGHQIYSTSVTTIGNITSSNSLDFGSKGDGGGNFLNGEIDTVHIFAKALVASEVENLYASEKQNFPALALAQ